jgi:cytochrome oxidase Cu insertion factor (SCO1/SenC/PrrC family)
MKRVKLMLLSFCVLAAVGGALAFKAKGTLNFCYATANVVGPDFCKDNGVVKKCIDHTIKGKTTTQNFWFCTTPTVVGSDPCPATLDCGLISVKSTTTE